MCTDRGAARAAIPRARRDFAPDSEGIDHCHARERERDSPCALIRSHISRRESSIREASAEKRGGRRGCKRVHMADHREESKHNIHHLSTETNAAWESVYVFRMDLTDEAEDFFVHESLRCRAARRELGT